MEFVTPHSMNTKTQLDQFINSPVTLFLINLFLHLFLFFHPVFFFFCTFLWFLPSFLSKLLCSFKFILSWLIVEVFKPMNLLLIIVLAK